MPSPMITLAEYKAAIGRPNEPDPSDDKITFALSSASSLIRNYTGLAFEVSGISPISTPRRFEYDGSGYLDIDECQAITGVSSESGYSGMPSSMPLTTDDWSAYPLNGMVKTWLRLAEGSGGYGMSPAMGFTWNLDTLYGRRGTGAIKPTIITVTAAWGWPVIPDDVKQAVIWTVASLTDTERPYTQESIENYSRTRGGADSEEPIPLRAQAVLQNYIIPRL